MRKKRIIKITEIIIDILLLVLFIIYGLLNNKTEGHKIISTAVFWVWLNFDSTISIYLASDKFRASLTISIFNFVISIFLTLNYLYKLIDLSFPIVSLLILIFIITTCINFLIRHHYSFGKLLDED